VKKIKYAHIYHWSPPTGMEHSLVLKNQTDSAWTTGPCLALSGDQPFRDTNAQGRIAFHLSPTMQLVARMFAGNSFGKAFGDPDIIGNATGVGIVNAIAVSPAQLSLYQAGVPISQLNGGRATFIPAPDDPDNTRAARFLTGALILTGQPAARLDYSVSYQVLANSRRYGNGPAGAGPYQPDSSTRSLYDGRIQTVNVHLNYRLGSANLLTAGYEFESENYANDNAQQYVPLAASATNVTQLSHTVFAQDQARFFGGQLQISLPSSALSRPRHTRTPPSRLRPRLTPETVPSRTFSAGAPPSCARTWAAAIARRRFTRDLEPASIRCTVIPSTAIRASRRSTPSVSTRASTGRFSAAV